MFGLLVSPTPEQGESLVGYLHRLGDCNGLWNGEVVKLFKELTDEQLHEWLSENNRPVSWRQMSTEIRVPRFSHQNVWSLGKVKYCPICLASGFYWRELWDLTLYTTCTAHMVELLYNCPECKSKSTQSILLTKCCGNCGIPTLKEYVQPTDIDGPKFWISAELEKRLTHRSENNSSGIDSLNLEQFHFLAIRIGVRALSRKYFMNMTVASMASKNALPDLATAAGKVLMGWPQSFHDLLTGLRELRASKFNCSLGSAFGRIYNDVYLTLTDRCYDFIRAEFEKYVVQNWEGPLALRNRRLSESTLLAHRWFPYHKAAREVGLPENFLRRMSFAGELNTREFIYSCGKTIAVVDIEEVRKLSSIRHEPLNLRETARLLCLSRKRIEQLINADVLKFFGGSPHAGQKWLVDYASIVALTSVEFQANTNEDLITISQIAKHYLPASGGLAELVGAIQSGEIRVFCGAESENVNVGKWLVSLNELIQSKITIPICVKEKGMSVACAAKMLGVKEEVAYALVRLGRLRSETVQCARRTTQVVSLGAIKHFKRNYILAPEVALVLGIPRVNALLKLRAGCFLPVAGPSMLHAKCRQYVWRRSKKLTGYLVSARDFCDKPE